ncbi:ThiF family adenylyltransferase [Streptomyces calidiresistens]
MIKPALLRGWDDRETVRYGITPPQAVVLGPVDGPTESFLSLLDGTRGMTTLRRAAARLGLRPDAADRLTARLASLGLVEDAVAERRAAAEVDERLRPDLATLSLLCREPGGARRRLAARRSARVRVVGAGRVGAAVAAVLSGAGIGDVEVVDGGTVESRDVSAAGFAPEHVGRRRNAAAASLVRRLRPRGREGGGGERPSRGRRGSQPAGPRLVIIAPRDGVSAYAPSPEAVEHLMEAGIPHLYAGVVETTGFVGPLVLPGRTPCAGCLMRERERREAGWPLLVGQWRHGRRAAGTPSCDTALATTVAGLAAVAALGVVDGAPGCPPEAGAPGHGGGTPPGADSGAEWCGRLEVTLPGPRVERQAVVADPGCPCGAAAFRPAGGSGASSDDGAPAPRSPAP